MLKTDVLVIGSGLSGLRCAYEASKKCDVLLIANGMGASPYVHGINIPLHDDDSIELFLSDTLNSGKNLADKSLAETLCKESIKLTDEFEFDKDANGKYDLLKPLGSSVPRVASIQNKTGVSIINKITNEKNFTTINNARVLKLKVENNTILGAYCFDLDKKCWFFVSAKSVVIATGGFGGIFPFSTNSSDIGGDGLVMALEAGASLRDMEFIQFEPFVAVYPQALVGKSIITTMLYEGAVIRNGKNERFMNECVNKDELSCGIYSEIINGSPTNHQGVFYDMTKVDKNLFSTKYKDYYQRYKNHNIDISKECVEIAPGAHTTLGGIEINKNCQTSVDGLFACGEVTGGLHGANRLGGNAGLEILVFGKIAGKNASEYALNTPLREACDFSVENEEFDNSILKKELRIATGKYLNIIRDEKSLANLIDIAENVIEKTKEHENSFSAKRLYNDAVTVKISAMSALERKKSIGSHIRVDSVSEDENYNVFAHLKNGKVEVERRKINER